MKVVINKCYGGFGLSEKAIELYKKLSGEQNVYDFCIPRTDKHLIEVIEQLGKDANNEYSNLAIVEIPDGIEYEIDDYDGMETIHEHHRTWD